MHAINETNTNWFIGIIDALASLDFLWLTNLPDEIMSMSDFEFTIKVIFYNITICWKICMLNCNCYNL